MNDLLDINFDNVVLTGLEAGINTTNNKTGQPIEIPIDDIQEDPNQPRKNFDDKKLQRLATNIKARGVKTPISVKPKNAAGKHIINHGARRFRASRLAGKATVPAFVDAIHDKYDQVAENLLRDDLPPMDLALFIQERVTANDKKSDIADRLGQENQSFISEHLALINAPASIQALAAIPQGIGSKTLYILCKAYEKKPAEIEHYLATTEEITRPGIKAIIDGKPQLKEQSSPSIAPAPLLAETVAELVSDNEQPDDEGYKGETSTPLELPTLPAKGSSPQAAKPTVDLSPRQLVIAVKVDGRLARIKQSGNVSVTFEETGETVEIEFAAIEIVGTKPV